MLYLEPEVDYFRIRLHQLALPYEICHSNSTKFSHSPEMTTLKETNKEKQYKNQNKDKKEKEEKEKETFNGISDSISLEEKAETLHRALLTSLHQRFPYESHDTLENVYILAVTHLASPPFTELKLNCEEFSELQAPESFLPPELRCRTFHSHLNILLLPSNRPSSSSVSSSISTGGNVDKNKEKDKVKIIDSIETKRYNDTYFILVPELTSDQQKLYHQRQLDTNETRYRRTALGGLSPSTSTLGESEILNNETKFNKEDIVKVGEGMIGFRVVDGNMLHYVPASTNIENREIAPRSLQFSVFKLPLNRFEPEEQQYYANKREEIRFRGDIPFSNCSSSSFKKGGISSSNSLKNEKINETMRMMLASEIPERYRVEDDSSTMKFFSKCNSILHCYTSPLSIMKETVKNDKDTCDLNSKPINLKDEFKTPRHSLGNTISSLGVRRLVYSFAPCDCYHLVTDDNNPLYYSKSSRAAYDARTVSITLVSDLTSAPWSSPTISLSSHNSLGLPSSSITGFNNNNNNNNNNEIIAGLEGLVSSKQASRAASPEPINSWKTSNTREDHRSPSPQPLLPKKKSSGKSGSRRASFDQFISKTDGFLRLTTSLSCNNVSGNPKHRKESLLEKGFFLNEHQKSQNGINLSNGMGNTKEHLQKNDAVVNLFRLLSISSAAQHKLRQGTIRPVISVAVLDKNEYSINNTFKNQENSKNKCHGLLDHTWYSIPVQSLPKVQDDIQWMPIIFGSTECISDFGYRTAMQMGFFSNEKISKEINLNFNSTNSGVLPTVEGAKQSLSGTQQYKSALAPRDPNVIITKQENNQKSNNNASSLPHGNPTTILNEERPASVTARRGGVAMEFGTQNDERPAGVTARRGGVAMEFGTQNNERPASVTVRRGGVAMEFGTQNDERPASVTARRGGVAMEFGTQNNERPASVTARRGGVAMEFGTQNDERPASVTARRGGVAMEFGTRNDERPASVTVRRGGVAMEFGTQNDERPASVTARRGGVAMEFGTQNDERPASVTARRGGVAMEFGTENDERPAGVTARRGGVAMNVEAGPFHNNYNNYDMNREAGARGGAAEREEPPGRRTMIGGSGSDLDWRRSLSYRSPNAQRLTAPEPEPASTNSNSNNNNNINNCNYNNYDGEGSPTALASTARPHLQVRTSGFPRGEFTGVSQSDDFRGTPAGKWGVSTPGKGFGAGSASKVPGYNNNNNNRGFVSDRWGGIQRSTLAREDSPVPGLFFPQQQRGMQSSFRSRPTTVMDPFGKLSNSSTPRPLNSTPNQINGRETQFNFSYKDRWQSNDIGNDIRNTNIPEQRAGTFWRPSSFGTSLPHGTSDPLASPLSSMSHSGFIPHEEIHQNLRGGLTSDGLNRFSQPSTFNRPNNSSFMGMRLTNSQYPINNMNSCGNNWDRSNNTLPNRSPNHIFEGMNTLYNNNNNSRIPIIDEYDYPRNGTRIRPRGVQAMDVASSRHWAPPNNNNNNSKTNSSTNFSQRRVTPPLYSRRCGNNNNNNNNNTMPWRQRTNTGFNNIRRGYPINKPPLAPAARSTFRTTPVTSTGLKRSTLTPPSVRGLTLRERVRLRQQQQRRESNLDIINQELNNNYCMGNDIKRTRLEQNNNNNPLNENFFSDINSINKNSEQFINSAFKNLHEIGKNSSEIETETIKSSNTYGEEMKNLKSLTNSFNEADGINVSFCIRDLANAFLHMPNGAPKEYDITKAIWLDDGVSYFVSSKPTRFRGGWESYLQNLNLYQQPFYLRERAFIFVLRVPYNPQLRVCIAVHNMEDFISILNQRPLIEILPTKEQKWMQERLYGVDAENQSNQDKNISHVKQGLLTRLYHTFISNNKKSNALDKSKQREEEKENNNNQYQTGWKPLTWRQRWNLIKLQAEASLRGRAWKVCTTPLLTEPTILQARMSFLSNRTASYAALRHRLNILKYFSINCIQKQRIEANKEQVRLIQDRIHRASSIQLGQDISNTLNKNSYTFSQNNLQEKELPINSVMNSTKLPTTSVMNSKKLSTTTTTRTARVPFRVNRIGDGAATATRRLRQPTNNNNNNNNNIRNPIDLKETTENIETFTQTRIGIQTQLKSTLAPYASTVSLSRPQSPTPEQEEKENKDLLSSSEGNQNNICKNEEINALIQVAANIEAKKDFAREVLPPPMTTVLKFISSLEQKEQQQETFNTFSKQSKDSTLKTTNNPIFAGLLPTPTEIHRQQECFDISVSQLQQLLQWQWEHYQNSYEALPIPIFRGALVTFTESYFGNNNNNNNNNEEIVKSKKSLGISPLSRSLLISLIKWGWLIPIDYEFSRSDAQLRFIAENNISSSSFLFGFHIGKTKNSICWPIWILLFMTLWRDQVLCFFLLYAASRCFFTAFKSIFGNSIQWLSPLNSATSIIYKQSEAAVEVMLENRQHFRAQLLATRILQTQNYIHNIISRISMLLHGYSPILLFIIGCEIVLLWFLFMCYEYSIYLFNTYALYEVIYKFFIPLLEPIVFTKEYKIINWCISFLQPSGGDGKTVGFLFLLYVLWRFIPKSPLRWILRTTWEIFLHDDALVRRPLLSF